MAQLRIGCVVMAAGNARRFGENKLAVQVQGKALFHRALEAVPAERFVRTVVVSQYPEVLELAHRMGFVPVPNRHPDWGISHTISLGLGKLPEMDVSGGRSAPAAPGERGEPSGLLPGASGAHRCAGSRRCPGEPLPVPGTAVPGAAGPAGRSRRQSGDPPP